jgi:hypothetical protein
LWSCPRNLAALTGEVEFKVKEKRRHNASWTSPWGEPDLAGPSNLDAAMTRTKHSAYLQLLWVIWMKPWLSRSIRRIYSCSEWSGWSHDSHEAFSVSTAALSDLDEAMTRTKHSAYLQLSDLDAVMTLPKHPAYPGFQLFRDRSGSDLTMVVVLLYTRAGRGDNRYHLDTT